MKKKKWLLIVSFLISLLLNLIILFFMVKFLDKPIISVNKSKKIVIKLFPEEKKVKKKEKIKGQIVELQKPEKEKVPEKAEFLSRYNSKVKKQQKALKMKKGGKTVEKVLKYYKNNSNKNKKNKIKKYQKKKQDQKKTVKKKKVEKKYQKSILFKNKNASVLKNATTPEEMFENIKTIENSGAINNSFASDDALLTVKNIGKETLLNSRKFKYWDFFFKIKKAVKKQWHPDRAYRMRDPYGNIYPRRNRLTVLMVILDKKGDIEKIVMVKKSGLPFLDEEALNAMKKAGPFPNPPKGLLDENGKIKFNFGFYFELNSPASKGFWK